MVLTHSLKVKKNFSSLLATGSTLFILQVSASKVQILWELKPVSVSGHRNKVDRDTTKRMVNLPDSPSVPLRVMVQTSDRKHYFFCLFVFWLTILLFGSILLSYFYSLLS